MPWKFKRLSRRIRENANSKPAVPQERQTTLNGVTPTQAPQPSNALGENTSINASIQAETTSNEITISSNILDSVFAKLPEKDQHILKPYLITTSSIDATATLDAILKDAHQQHNKIRNESWEIEVFGNKFEIRDLTERVINWLERFKTLGDTAASVDPIHAGLPWAGINILLKAALSDSEQNAALLFGFDRVFYVLNRCKAYSAMQLASSSHQQAKQNFESALESLYTLILQFLATALHTYSKGAAGRAWQAFWSPDDILNFEKNCIQAETRANYEATLFEQGLQGDERAKAAQRFQDLMKELNELKDTGGLKTIDAKLEDILRYEKSAWKQQQDEFQTEVLIWISQVPYADNHETARKGRIGNTGGWLLEHRLYTRWETSIDTRIFWLHGIPGAGKTKLISRVVDNIQSRPIQEGVAYFYCNRQEQSRTTTNAVLCSWVKQLALNRNDKTLHESLVQLYESKKSTGFISKNATNNEAEKLLIDISRTFTAVTLVLDALDECDHESQVELLEVFDRLISSYKYIKILISSRRDRQIKSRLETRTNVSIEATDNESDIQTYILIRLEENEKRRMKDGWQPISPDIKDEITNVLFSKSQGMFQWAVLQLSLLLSHELERDVRNMLGALPADLNATYDYIYKDCILGQTASRRDIALRSFSWVSCAVVPLTVDELVAAVCQDPGKNIPEAIYVNIEIILDACRNLLVVNSDGFCRFGHLSILEYLEQQQNLSRTETNNYVAEVCLIALNYPLYHTHNTKDKLLKQEQCNDKLFSSQLMKLLDHIRSFWPEYAQIGLSYNKSDRLLILLNEFFKPLEGSGKSYQAWYRSHGFYSRSNKQSALVEKNRYYLSLRSPSIVPICAFGFTKLLEDFCQSGFFNPNMEIENDVTLLSLVSLNNFKDMVAVLIDRGADVNAKLGGRYGSALAAAVHEGNDAIIQLLLDHGADVNAQLGGIYGSALAVAAYEGNDAIIQLLLDHGADVNAQLGGLYGSALAAAAWCGYIATVQLLLDHGADVNAQSGGKYGSALAAAVAWHGHTATIQLLLDHDADVNAQLGGIYGSALAAAAAAHYENTTIIQLLLDRGADVNAQLDGKYGSALAAAAYYSSNDSIRVFLDHGADINAQLGGPYGSALAAALAAHEEHDDCSTTIQLLLDHGAEHSRTRETEAVAGEVLEA